jgi:hypothetical protein
MMNRREVLLGSVSAVALTVTGGDSPTVDELRLLAIAVAPRSASKEGYNRDRTVGPGTNEKKMIDSLIDRGFFSSRDNHDPDIECDYIVEPTKKGLIALRAAGVTV